MKDNYNIYYFFILLFFILNFSIVNANGTGCLTSYHDICKDDSGLCKQVWTSECSYCEVDTIEYSCALPSGGGSAYCGFAERCVVVVPPPPSTCANVGSEYFVGCYLDLYSDPSAPFIRSDPTINFFWGTDSPDASLYDDYFSVKWEGDFTFPESGSYLFSTETDDGVRLYIDGVLIRDAWYDRGTTLDEDVVVLTSGVHRIKVEYYEKGGGATAHVWWELNNTLNAPDVPTISGDVSSLVGSSYAFQVHTDDPQGYNIRFGADWSNPLDGVVDEWIPSSGYLSSGTYQNSSHIFSTSGDITFGILAQNEWGSNSGWRYKEVSVYNPDAILDATPSSTNIGSTVTVNFSGVVNPMSLDWIGLYLTNEYDDFQYIDWVYTSTCTQTGGTARDSGFCNFTMPGVPGNYNFRLFEDDGWRKISTSNTVTVSDPGGEDFLITVSVLQGPGGSIQSTDTIIDTKICGSPCIKTYAQGSNVTLQAIPSSSYWKFNGWSGGCTGLGSCVVSVDSDVTVSASFVPRFFFYKEE